MYIEILIFRFFVIQISVRENFIIEIDLGISDGRGMAWGSDLTEEYVIFNSAYTT